MTTITDGGVMKKRILNRSRLREIQGGFAFIPHRFLNDGFIKRLGPDELLLYLFLILVSDAYGLSYYGDPAICRFLGLNLPALEQGRQILIDEDLIAFETPIYQVLELPTKPVEVTEATGSHPSFSPSSFSQLSHSLGD
jgi:hypothetical protein